MEIVLKDGTVLQAADDADPRDVKRRFGIQQLKAAHPEEYDPNSEAFHQKNAPVKYIDVPVNRRGPGTGTAEGGGRGTMNMVDPSIENERAAVGSGLLRGWKGLTNLVLPDKLTPEWASDKNIEEMDKLDQDLPAEGKMLGGIAATAPLGGGTGAALGTGSRAVGAGSMLGRALASPLTRTAVEGGLNGAVFADPKEQGEGALAGSVLGMTLHGAGKGAGRLTRGLIEKSQAAKDLEQLASQHGEEIFTPVAQAASEDGIVNSLGKGFYKEALPIVPGVRGQVTRQSEAAAEKLREIAVKEALPPGATMPANAGKNVSGATSQMKQQFDDVFDKTVKSYSFNVPKDLKQQIVSIIKAKADPKTTVDSTTLDKISSEVDAIMKRFSDGKSSIDGQNLLNVKSEISDLLKQAPGHQKGAYGAADQWIEDHIASELKQGGSKVNLADLQKYLDSKPAYRAFIPLKKSAEQSVDKEGRFLFRTLARNAKNSPEQRALGQIGAETLDKSVATGGITGKILAGLGMGGTGIGAFMSLPATLTMLGAGNVLASKGAQKAVLGDTKMQKFIVELLRNNPRLARNAGSAARAATVQAAVGDNYE